MSSTYIFAIVLLLMLSSRSSLAAPRVVCSDDEMTCGAQCYDPNRKLCCGGRTLIELAMTSRIDCCNGLLYDKTEQTCCGSQLIELSDDESSTTGRRCCGGKAAYDVTSELCCGDVVQPRKILIDSVSPSGERRRTEAQCCGNGTYDESTQECCESDLDPAVLFSVRTRQPGRHYGCCGPRVIDIDDEDCPGEGLPGMTDYGNDDDDDTPATCGPSGLGYNRREQLCCNGVLHSLSTYRGQAVECCGSVVYDVTRSICCSHDDDIRVVDVTTGNEICCRHAPHGFVDSTTHTCCAGRPHLLPASSVHSFVCCGDSFIDIRIRGCCSSVDMETATPFDRLVTKCCGGHVISVDAECCASRWPMPAGTVCCHHSGPVARRRHGDNACCETRFGASIGLPYNRNDEVCHGGRVAARWSVATCAGHTYNTMTQSCCAGRLFDDKPQAQHTCVNGVPVPNREGRVVETPAWPTAGRHHQRDASSSSAGTRRRHHPRRHSNDNAAPAR